MAWGVTAPAQGQSAGTLQASGHRHLGSSLPSPACGEALRDGKQAGGGPWEWVKVKVRGGAGGGPMGSSHSGSISEAVAEQLPGHGLGRPFVSPPSVTLWTAAAHIFYLRIRGDCTFEIHHEIVSKCFLS